jgi:outer membrane protein assembly factor BamB
VYALNAATGARQWSFIIGDSIDSSPAVAGRIIYIGGDDRMVYASWQIGPDSQD